MNCKDKTYMTKNASRYFPQLRCHSRFFGEPESPEDTAIHLTRPSE